jgi:hypothetical protein
MTLRKGTYYTENEYREASTRIINYINLEDIENDQQLERELKLKLGIDYDSIKSGNATIYKNVLDAFDRKTIKDAEEQKEISVAPVRTRKQRVKLKRTQTRRAGIRELSGLNRTRITFNKSGDVQTLILHRNRYYSQDKLIIYELKGKIVTRRKPVKKSKT